MISKERTWIKKTGLPADKTEKSYIKVFGFHINFFPNPFDSKLVSICA